MKKIMRNSFILLVICFLLMLPNLSLATNMKEDSSITIIASTINPDDYKPGSITDDADTQSIAQKAGVIMNIIFIIGIVVSVISMIIIGIKYMVGSVEEKAEYKKTMIPYIVGIAFIASASAIVKIIASIVIPISETM